MTLTLLQTVIKHILELLTREDVLNGICHIIATDALQLEATVFAYTDFTLRTKHIEVQIRISLLFLRFCGYLGLSLRSSGLGLDDLLNDCLNRLAVGR